MVAAVLRVPACGSGRLLPRRLRARASATASSAMGKGADRKRKNNANRRARGEAWSEIQGKRHAAVGPSWGAWSPAATGMAAATALPPLLPGLLGVAAERHTTQPAGPSVHAQQPGMANINGMVAESGAEPPNVGRLGEEYAVAWLRHHHATSTVRWLNDADEQHADHDIEIRAEHETEWRHVEVKTRWSGCDPRMNQMSDRQRERLLDPGDSYMLLLLGDASRLFESPAAPPRVRLYESPHPRGACVEGMPSRLWNGVYIATGDCEARPRFENAAGRHLWYSVAERRVWLLSDAYEPAEKNPAGRAFTSELSHGQLPVGRRDWQVFHNKEWQDLPLTVTLLATDADVDEQKERLAAEGKAKRAAAKAAALQQLKGKAVGVDGMSNLEFNGVYVAAGDHEGCPRFENAEEKQLYYSIERSQWVLRDTFVPAPRTASAWADAADGMLPVGQTAWRGSKEPVTVSLLSVEEALQQQTRRLRDSHRTSKDAAVTQIFAMFDADCDGKLNKEEYRAYLEGIKCWGTKTCTDEGYDATGWAEQCAQLECRADEGITAEAFRSILYEQTNRGSKLQADLDSCKEWKAKFAPTEVVDDKPMELNELVAMDGRSSFTMAFMKEFVAGSKVPMTGKFKRLVESLGIGEGGPPADCGFGAGAGGGGGGFGDGKWERGAVCIRPTYELNKTGHGE